VEEIKNENASSCSGIVHDANNIKMFTRQLPALSDNCFLTSAVTTDVYKQDTATYPLLLAPAKRRVLCASSAIYFLSFYDLKAQLNTY
jgi:hypothetical protein